MGSIVVSVHSAEMSGGWQRVAHLLQVTMLLQGEVKRERLNCVGVLRWLLLSTTACGPPIHSRLLMLDC
jgi:hypothetical protein